MSYLKTAPDLFLEKQELDRMKKFLDDDGFRNHLIQNSLKFGLIDKQFNNESNTVQEQFTNALVTEDTGLTIKHNEIKAIDKLGRLIYRPQTIQIVIPATGFWYWLKIAYVASVYELGTWAIDSSGNVTGTNGEALTILRGMPNFPSRVKFVDSSLNTQEYDVLEVIDDNNFILNGSYGSFNAETDLTLAVVGTFTEGSVPSSQDKYPFQYDSCMFYTILESVLNTPPALTDGYEFLIARVKNDGVSIVVQDKRNSIWTTKSNFRLSKVDTNANPLLGIESVKFDHTYSTKDRNKVFLSWAFRSSNYSVNTNLNIVTLNSGTGGKFKDVTYFTDGDFDGWRIYTSEGKYIRIVSSIKTGGQINLYVDKLDVDLFSSDGGTTFTNEEISIVPDSEKIELKFIPQDIASTSLIVETFDYLVKNFEFNINEFYAICDLLVYNTPTSEYEVQYRYKSHDTYSQWFTMAADTTFGYYTESAFEVDGSLKSTVIANTYGDNVTQGFIKLTTSSLVTLTLSASAYYPLIQSIITGDRLGVERVTLDPTIVQPFQLTVGSSRMYQYFEGTFGLTQDFYININNTGAINGNRFYLHFKNAVSLNGFTLKLVTDFVTIASYTLIDEYSTFDESITQSGTRGILFELVHDGTQWEIKHSNYDRGLSAYLWFIQSIQTSTLATHSADIGVLQTNVATNTADIATNAADIAAHEVRLDDIEDAWVTESITDGHFALTGATFSTTSGICKYKIIGKTVFYKGSFHTTIAGAPSAGIGLSILLPNSNTNNGMMEGLLFVSQGGGANEIFKIIAGTSSSYYAIKQLATGGTVATGQMVVDISASFEIN